MNIILTSIRPCVEMMFSQLFIWTRRSHKHSRLGWIIFSPMEGMWAPSVNVSEFEKSVASTEQSRGCDLFQSPGLY